MTCQENLFRQIEFLRHQLPLVVKKQVVEKILFHAEPRKVAQCQIRLKRGDVHYDGRGDPCRGFVCYFKSIFKRTLLKKTDLPVECLDAAVNPRGMFCFGMSVDGAACGEIVGCVDNEIDRYLFGAPLLKVAIVRDRFDEGAALLYEPRV